jgi:hypothetical protein
MAAVTKHAVNTQRRSLRAQRLMERNGIAAKFWLMVDGIRTGRTDGGLVRITTLIKADETDDIAEARLQNVLQELRTPLPRFMPRGWASAVQVMSGGQGPSAERRLNKSKNCTKFSHMNRA